MGRFGKPEEVVGIALYLASDASSCVTSQSLCGWGLVCLLAAFSMVKTKIGIKYCGGCNPRYERIGMIRQVQSLAGDGYLFLRHDQEGLNGLIAVDGCFRACAVKDLHQRGVSYRSIVEEGNVNSLMEWLLVLEQKGDRE
jgi:hypothetical protein